MQPGDGWCCYVVSLVWHKNLTKGSGGRGTLHGKPSLVQVNKGSYSEANTFSSVLRAEAPFRTDHVPEMPGFLSDSEIQQSQIAVNSAFASGPGQRHNQG